MNLDDAMTIAQEHLERGWDHCEISRENLALLASAAREVDRYRQALEEVDSLRIQMALVVNTALSSGHAVLSGRAEGETT